MWNVTITPSWDSTSPLATLMGSLYSWRPNERPLAILMGLYTSPISGWAMSLIPFVTTHPNDTILFAFGFLKSNFLGGHSSQYYSRRSTLNCGVLIGSLPSYHDFKTRCVNKGVNIHISTSPSPGNMERRNQYYF
jgi:hypothetical protein